MRWTSFTVKRDLSVAPETKELAWYLCIPVVALAFSTMTARASCLPLADVSLRELDAEISLNPKRALSEANDRLVRLTPSTSKLFQAQLYAIVAESDADLDKLREATDSIDAGLAVLQASAASEAVSRTRLRLELQRTELESSSANATAAIAELDNLIQAIPDESLDRACALSQRAIAYDFMNEPDGAVRDALAAYRLAVDHGWSLPRIETAYTLAVNFRRAGLYEQAEKMIDEVVTLETANNMLQNMADAYYERGQLLIAMQRFPEARTALGMSRRFAILADDRLGATASTIPLCLAEIDDHDLSEADVTCNADREALVEANRVDLATLLESYQARLDLEHNLPRKALLKLDRILSGPVHRLLPVQESQIYRDRARALSVLRRYADAYADISRAAVLDTASGIEKRHRQVAMLSALAESERLLANNRLLEENLSAQQKDLLQQKHARLLWRAVAAVSIVTCALFICLLVARKRGMRRLRRYEIILNHAWSRAPHALLMLDENRRVCFANRPLIGTGPAPAIGTALVDIIPTDLLSQITQAIDGAFKTARFACLDVVFYQPNLPERYYEVYILPAVDSGEALGVTLQSIDVTELRSLERQFVDDASRERQDLGSELHEGLAQELTGVLFMLSSLSNSLRRGSTDCAPLVTEASEQLAKSISLARRMAQEMAPVTVERGSLPDALRRLTELAASRLGIRVSCDCPDGDRRITDLAADHVHQFCREALIEAALIEHCDYVRFEMRFVGDSLEIQLVGTRRSNHISDQPHSAPPSKMSAFRARLLGGHIHYGPNLEREFRLTLTIPLCQLQNRTDLDAAEFESEHAVPHTVLPTYISVGS